MTHTHIRHFKSGIMAKMVITDDPLGFSVEWSRNPTREIIPEYLEWRDTAIRQHAKRTKQNIIIVTA